MMTDNELDTVYTGLCHAMTRLGEANAALFLARFALLAIEEIGDARASVRLIDAAQEWMAAGEAGEQAGG